MGGQTVLGSVRWPLVGRGAERDEVLTALLDPRGQGVLLCGPAGVGKTRLADDCLDAMRRRGRVAARITATAAAASVPLGALVPLLPSPSGAPDPVALFDRTAEVFRERAGGGALLLLVDDVHLLDVTSAVLLGQLLDASAAVVLATLRTGERVPAEVAAWWSSGRMIRIDLGDLDEQAVDSLLHLALGGPVTAPSAGQVWAASRGNPLLVRELLLGARAAGDLVEDGGVWRLTGPVRGSPRLVELIEARLHSAGPGVGSVLEQLALVEPVGLAELEEMAGPATVETAERGGLIEVRPERRRLRVTLAHPLYGEVLRARTPRSARRRLLLDQARRVQSYGARRREDPLRIAGWQLDATGTAETGLLLTAARLARYSYDLEHAARLARAALADLPPGPGRIEAQLVLGEALNELGEFAGAEAVLAESDPAVTDERQLALVVAVRANGLLWGLRDPERALEVIRAARKRTRDPEVRRELVADEATVLVFSGHPAEALGVLESFGPGGELRARAIRAIAEASALVGVGRCETALAVATQGLSDHTALGDQMAISHIGAHVLTQSYALQDAGRLAEATELATAGYAVASRDRSAIGRIWFAIHLGRVAIFGGRPVTARRWLVEARALCREFGWAGPHRLTLHGLAMVCAWLGDTAAARTALAELDELADFGFLTTETDLGRAWTVAADGDVQSARDIVRLAAARAAEVGHVSSEVWLLHDLARLGDPEGVYDRLTELAARGEGQLTPAYAEHARAAAGQDPEALVAAANRFERIGARLLAAEAATEAGHAYQRGGQARQAAGQRARAAGLAAGCEGARTPALVTAAAVVPLTRREREIVLLAARGQASRDIAAKLYLSVRTVDNHLQNAYTKLGVTGREQLEAALTRRGER